MEAVRLALIVDGAKLLAPTSLCEFWIRYSVAIIDDRFQKQCWSVGRIFRGNVNTSHAGSVPVFIAESYCLLACYPI